MPVSDEIDRWISDLTSRREATVTAMRAEGREPAPVDSLGTINGVFDFTLRWVTEATDEAEIRLFSRLSRDGYPVVVWGQSWPERGAKLSGGLFLGILARNLRRIGRAYLRDPSAIAYEMKSNPRTSVDFTGDTGDVHDARFSLVMEGSSITLRTREGSYDFGSESVIVVETLMALGDVIADRLRNLDSQYKTVEYWEAERKHVDLLPMALDIGPEDTENSDTTDIETAFWARRLGHDVAEYRRAARWLQARQWMFAEGKDPEPEFSEWNVETLPPDLPDEHVVDDMVAKALMLEVAKSMEITTDREFDRQALMQRNMNARQHVFYGRSEDETPSHDFD